ncbi:MAG: 2-succinyl-5-enolpyruvyl-6-hydroxy-3-cyclohexene-1-carboxylic-acid synthase [Actinomycetota bacterium]
MTDPVYDPIAAFAGQLAAHGVRDVVISPGSRSTPLAVTFHAHPDLRTHIQLDERSAGFFALGQAKASGRPSVLICTSGTAAANYLPAVVEANHACVPMIVCTADRPPELRGWGAGQTIDQVGMFTSNVRWAADLPVPSDWSEAAARLAASRAFDASTGDGRGPVHLNWPLRKPLEPVAGVSVRTYEPLDHRPGLWSSSGEPFASLAGIEKGVILVGPDASPGVKPSFRLADAIADLGDAVGWPIIAEPMTQLRFRHRPSVLAAGEHLLKHAPVADELRPDVVVRFGAAPTTAPVNQWLERVRPDQVVAIDPEQRWHDASFTTTSHLAVDPLIYAMNAAGRIGVEPGPWLERWRQVDDAAMGAIDAELGAGARSSGSVVRDLCSIADGEPLFVMSSNSMPPRDLDSYVPAGTPIGFVGNRGAAGIDGITSTALGIASHLGADARVVVFTGDLALLHDIGGLLGVQRAGEHLTVLCVDNDGGQIFSMLPIHDRIDAADYEAIFRTPHGIDLAHLDGLAGIEVSVIEEEDDLAAALQAATSKTEPGVDLLIVRVDPEHDMAVRRRIRDAVGTAIAP